MNRKKELLIVSLLLIGSISLASLAQTIAQGAQRAPTTSTIPPAPITAKGVLLECSPSVLFPGSVNTLTTGFLRVKCPTTGYAQLGINGNISLTPTFILPSGYLNASIIVSQSAGSPCSFRFSTLTSGNVTFPSGMILNSGSPITFGSPVFQGQMQAGLYDYCIQYDSSQSGSAIQIAGFSITWA